VREPILAIDTTSERGSLALADGSRLIEEVQLRSADGFAHVLFGEIDRLLARHGMRIEDIACFAVASGPGAFTGVRVGLAAAKGLAEATGRKVVAVSNLQALASFGTGPLRAPVMDARRGDIFGAVYDADLKLVQNEVVMPFDAWLAMLPEGAEIVRAEVVPHGLAAAIARIAAGKFAQGLAQDPAEIDANYVRRSDAELMWRDAR
jgi:tRNA threonylcarbamoyladenosine biosynthesis protein TsaB